MCDILEYETMKGIMGRVSRCAMDAIVPIVDTQIESAIFGTLASSIEKWKCRYPTKEKKKQFTSFVKMGNLQKKKKEQSH